MIQNLIPFQHPDSNHNFNLSFDCSKEDDKIRCSASDLFWVHQKYLESAKERFKMLDRKSCCMMDLELLKGAVCYYAKHSNAGDKHFNLNEIYTIIHVCKKLLNDKFFNTNLTTQQFLKHLESKTDHNKSFKDMTLKTMLLLQSKNDNEYRLNRDVIQVIAMQYWAIINDYLDISQFTPDFHS